MASPRRKKHKKITKRNQPFGNIVAMTTLAYHAIKIIDVAGSSVFDTLHSLHIL